MPLSNMDLCFQSTAIAVDVLYICLIQSPLYVCDGQLFAAPNMAGNTTAITPLDTVKETGRRNLVFVVENSTLQFNFNYTIKFQVGEGNGNVLGNLSMLPFIGGPIITCTISMTLLSKQITIQVT